MLRIAAGTAATAISLATTSLRSRSTKDEVKKRRRAEGMNQRSPREGLTRTLRICEGSKDSTRVGAK
jgi:hypothetical protein